MAVCLGLNLPFVMKESGSGWVNRHLAAPPEHTSLLSIPISMGFTLLLREALMNRMTSDKWVTKMSVLIKM